MAHHKLTLPHKTCPACQRPFAWRRKWARRTLGWWLIANILLLVAAPIGGATVIAALL